MVAIRAYFTAFPLKTHKLESFTLWSQVHDMVTKKQHLTPKGLAEIQKLKSLINK
jgi:hypothetical protein